MSDEGLTIVVDGKTLVVGFFSGIGAGTGDVRGPATSVDNELTRFSGASGKIVQGSTGITIDDSGNITTPEGATINGVDVAALGLALYFSQAPTANGLIRLLGWYIQTNAAASLTSAAPVTAGGPGYHSHFVLDVSAASGLPFTIRITGVSIDESTGVETPADTEDLSITANGFYQSTKSWADAVEFSIVEAAKSCTIDVYRITYWDCGNKNFTLDGVRLEWEPDAVSWSIRLRILHVQDDGSAVEIDNVVFANTDAVPRAEKDQPGKYKRGDYDTAMMGASKEGIVIEVDQSGIGSFFLEAKRSA